MSKLLPDLPLLLENVPVSLRIALEQEGVPIADRQGVHRGRFVLFDSRLGQPSLNGDQVAIDVDPLRRGRAHDPFLALADERSARYAWQIGRLQVHETVARVDRAAVRRRLMSDLRTLVEAAGGLWLRLAPYPYPYRTVFNFRFDHDEYDARDFDATLGAIEGYEHAVSHYVCAATHVLHKDALARLQDLHVGSHGWRHHTYREQADNLTNIRRGIDRLRDCGLNPVGFAAPHGRFHRGLLACLEELRVSHSSEFGLACDDLPFFPHNSTVLQIPIHPICLGVCLDAARAMPDRPISDVDAAEATFEHWRTIAFEKHRAGEPMFFYGHPDGRVGRFPHIVRSLLAFASELPATWCTTLAAFEDWWRARSAVRLEAIRHNDQLEVMAQGLPRSYRCAIEWYRGQELATAEMDRPVKSLLHDNLAWQPRPAPSIRHGQRVPCATGLRATLHGFLDWERVTPINEISTRSWRGWAKKTLRRVRS